MSHKRLRTWQKATALVPLALLSGAWTASIAATTTASATAQHAHKLPDGTSIPNKAIKAPASVSVPGEIAPGVPAGSTESIISSASANGIPSAALAAYQRAAQVIDAADPSCHIGWQLIGAIGRVESNHGRYGGNTLTQDGRSHPGIYGIPLDGSNGTARISDTDAGQYDDDPIFDRAVGPMQFIPSTWSVVGVDGDGDGKRDPQDIDDAALATAVYLCSGHENLSTTAGQSSAVYRYNHSQDYVNLVLSIMRAYTDGEYASVPNGAAAPTVFAPAYSDSVISPRTSGRQTHTTRQGHQNSTGNTSPSNNGGGTGSTGGDSPTGGDTTTAPGTGGTGTSPGDTITKAPETIKKALTALQKATAYCQANLTSSELDAIGGLSACADAYLEGGASAVQSLLDDLLGDLGGGIVGGLPGL